MRSYVQLLRCVDGVVRVLRLRPRDEENTEGISFDEKLAAQDDPVSHQVGHRPGMLAWGKHSRTYNTSVEWVCLSKRKALQQVGSSVS